MKCILLLLLYFVIGCSSEVDNKDFYLLDNGQKEYFDTIDELFNKLPVFDQLFSDVVIALNTIEEGSRDLNNVYLHMSKELITNDFRDLSGYLLTNDEDVLESKIDNYYVNRAVYDKDKDEITVFISIKTEQKYRDEENLIQRLGVSDHQNISLM